MKELQIDDVKVEKEKKAQESTASERAAEKLKRAVRALNETDGDLETTFAAIREKQLIKDLEVIRAECADLKTQRDKMLDQITSLGKELNDVRRECLGLRGDISKMQREHEAEIADLKEERDALRAECLDYAEDRKRLRGELADAKKTISKMQQHHEAEVQDLKDQLGEAKAEANAIRKHKDEILKKHTEYADALDNDSVAFEEILGLAIILERSAKSMQEMSKMLQEKAEGKV